MHTRRIFSKLRFKAKDHTVDGLVDGSSKNNCSLLCILVKKKFYFLIFLIMKPVFECSYIFPSSVFNFSENKNLRCSEMILRLFKYHIVCVLNRFSCVRLFVTLCASPWGFSRQEYWSELPCPPPGDLPDPGYEPAPLNISCIGKQVLYHWHHPGSP